MEGVSENTKLNMKGAHIADPSADGDARTLKMSATDGIDVIVPSGPEDSEQKLTFWQAVGLNTMNMFGTGPLITIPYCVAAVNPMGTHALFGYGIALIACFCDSLIWAEIGSMWPTSGGSYVYLRELYGSKTFGRFVSFMFVWQFLLSGPAEAASGFIAIAEYLTYFSQDTVTYGYRVLISLCLLAFCTLLLARKITDIGKVTIVLSLVTVLAMVYTMVAGFTDWDASNLKAPPGAFSSSSKVMMNILAATKFGVYDMTGYYDINFMGSEVVNPKRTIPLSVIMTCTVVGVIYILVYVSVLGSFSVDKFVDMYTDDFEGVPVGIMSLFTEYRFNSPALAYIVTIVVCITIFGSTFAMLIGFVFIPVAAAKDGYFFQCFVPKAGKDGGDGLPFVSLAVIVGLSGVFCFFSLGIVIDAMTTLLCLMMFCGQSAGLMYYRYTTPKDQIPDGWKLPLFPLPCIVQFAIFFMIFLTSDSAFRGQDPVMELSVGFLIFGAICFLARSKMYKTWPFEEPKTGKDLEDSLENGGTDTLSTSCTFTE